MTEGTAIRLMKLRDIPFGNLKIIAGWLVAGCQKTTTQLLVISSIFWCLPSVYAAEATRSAYTPPPPAVSSGNIAQIIFSLLLVLAAIVLVGWLLKRMNVAQRGSGNLLKILGAVPIGQRERIVLVEVNNTCLVVGIGPGQIRTLHTFQKAEFQMTENSGQRAENSVADPQPSENKFASLLSSVLNRRRQKTIDK